MLLKVYKSSIKFSVVIVDVLFYFYFNFWGFIFWFVVRLIVVKIIVEFMEFFGIFCNLN